MDAARWDERYRSAELVWGLEPNRFVREFCESLPLGSAIDLACGEGRNGLWLAQLGWHVTGLDISAVAIDRARQLAESAGPEVVGRAAWHVADVTEWEPRPASFDLAIISYLQLSQDARDHALRSATVALRPKGHLVLVGHDVRNLTQGVGGPQDISLLYDPAQVAYVLAAAGLVVEFAQTVQRPTSNGIALDTLVHARCPGPPPIERDWG